MSPSGASDPPLAQRLYDRIFLLGLLALLFWAIAYVGWGIIDILTVPLGVLG
ncbi:MAG: hypothetical protein ABEH64_13375 [Salinirussus sp.]